MKNFIRNIAFAVVLVPVVLIVLLAMQLPWERES